MHFTEQCFAAVNASTAGTFHSFTFHTPAYGGGARLRGAFQINEGMSCGSTKRQHPELRNSVGHWCQQPHVCFSSCAKSHSIQYRLIQWFVGYGGRSKLTRGCQVQGVPTAYSHTPVPLVSVKKSLERRRCRTKRRDKWCPPGLQMEKDCIFVFTSRFTVSPNTAVSLKLGDSENAAHFRYPPYIQES